MNERILPREDGQQLRDSDRVRLENVVVDLEIAVEAARADLLKHSDALLIARRRLARYDTNRRLMGIR